MEIERKFLVKELPDLTGTVMIRMEQRYLSVDPVLRIRKADDKHIFTYKSGMGMIRQEEEFEISAEDYAKLCEKTIGHPVAKTRYVMELPDGHHAEIDVYHGRLDGLLVVETEFGSEEEANAFEPPVWFGTEVTDDTYYTNAMLAFKEE